MLEVVPTAEGVPATVISDSIMDCRRDTGWMIGRWDAWDMVLSEIRAWQCL